MVIVQLNWRSRDVDSPSATDPTASRTLFALFAGALFLINGLLDRASDNASIRRFRSIAGELDFNAQHERASRGRVVA